MATTTFTTPIATYVGPSRVRIEGITANLEIGSGATTGTDEYFTNIGDTGVNFESALPSIFHLASAALGNTTVAANLLQNGNLPARIMVAGAGGGGGGAVSGLGSGGAGGVFSPGGCPGGGGGAGGVVVLDRVYIPASSVLSVSQATGGAGGAGVNYNSGASGTAQYGSNGGQGGTTTLTITSGATTTTYTALGGGYGCRGSFLGPNYDGTTTAGLQSIAGGERGGDGGAGGGSTRSFDARNTVLLNGVSINNPYRFGCAANVTGGNATASTQLNDLTQQGFAGGAGQPVPGAGTDWSTYQAGAGAGGGATSAGTNCTRNTAAPARGGNGYAYFTSMLSNNRSNVANVGFVFSTGGGAGWNGAFTATFVQSPGGNINIPADAASTQAGTAFRLNNNGAYVTLSGAVNLAAGNPQGSTAGGTALSSGDLSSLGVGQGYTAGAGGGGGGWRAGTVSGLNGGAGAHGAAAVLFRSTLQALPLATAANLVIYGNTNISNGQANVGALQTQGGMTVTGNLFIGGNLIGLVGTGTDFVTVTYTDTATVSPGDIFFCSSYAANTSIAQTIGAVYRLGGAPGLVSFTVNNYSTAPLNYTIAQEGNYRFLGSPAPTDLRSFWQRVN